MKYDFDHVINRKLGKCRKWDNTILKEKFGLNEDAIPMDLADLDFECAPAIKQAMIERAALGDYGYTYTYDAYYDALIDWNKRRFHVDIKKEWIKLTFGTCGTLHYIVQCFCNEGDAVMINTPAYDPFAEAVERGGCRLIWKICAIILILKRWSIRWSKRMSSCLSSVHRKIQADASGRRRSCISSVHCV